LRGVGARLIERVGFHEVLVDRLFAQAAKAHAGYFEKACRSCAREMTNKNCGTDFVSLSAQATQNLPRFTEVTRLAHDLAIKRDERVGREHNFSRICARGRQAFADRIKRSQFAQRKIDMQFFIDLRRRDFKFITGGREQFASSRRM